jgi:hypothetical protein
MELRDTLRMDKRHFAVAQLSDEADDLRIGWHNHRVLGSKHLNSCDR